MPYTILAPIARPLEDSAAPIRALPALAVEHAVAVEPKVRRTRGARGKRGRGMGKDARRAAFMPRDGQPIRHTFEPTMRVRSSYCHVAVAKRIEARVVDAIDRKREIEARLAAE